MPSQTAPCSRPLGKQGISLTGFYSPQPEHCSEGARLISPAESEPSWSLGSQLCNSCFKMPVSEILGCDVPSAESRQFVGGGPEVPVSLSSMEEGLALLPYEQALGRLGPG